MEDRFIVICLDDDGQYRLTTRQTFETRAEAEHRAEPIAPSRKPIVVACDSRTVILRKEAL